MDTGDWEYAVLSEIAMPERHVLPTTEEAAQAMARFVADLAKEGLAAQGQFTIALSGGFTPRRLYQVVA